MRSYKWYVHMFEGTSRDSPDTVQNRDGIHRTNDHTSTFDDNRIDMESHAYNRGSTYFHMGDRKVG